MRNFLTHDFIPTLCRYFASTVHETPHSHSWCFRAEWMVSSTGLMHARHSCPIIPTNCVRHSSGSTILTMHRLLASSLIWKIHLSSLLPLLLPSSSSLMYGICRHPGRMTFLKRHLPNGPLI